MTQAANIAMRLPNSVIKLIYEISSKKGPSPCLHNGNFNIMGATFVKNIWAFWLSAILKVFSFFVFQTFHALQKDTKN